MIFRIDGHEIPVATADDFTDDELAAHGTRRNWDLDAAGHTEVFIPGHVPGKSVPFVLSNGGDPGPGYASFTVVPPVDDGDSELDMASLRPVRVAGHDSAIADREHQRRLFNAVGAVTVAGGHVEMALRKVLVSLNGWRNEDLARKDVALDWSALHAKVETLCEGNSSDLAQSVVELLKTEAAGLRDARNNIVHSYWWLPALDSGELWSGRYYNKGREPVTIVDTADSLCGLAEKLFDFAAELEALVADHWPLAIVPAVDSSELGQGPVDLVARFDRVTGVADG